MGPEPEWAIQMSFLALTWHSSGTWGYLENEPVDQRSLSLSHPFCNYIFQRNKSLTREKESPSTMRQHTCSQILTWTSAATPGISIWPEQSDVMNQSGHDKDGAGHGAGAAHSPMRHVSVEDKGLVRIPPRWQRTWPGHQHSRAVCTGSASTLTRGALFQKVPVFRDMALKRSAAISPEGEPGSSLRSQKCLGPPMERAGKRRVCS